MAQETLLSEMEMDMLHEVGSMGASHAANSLADMTGAKVRIEVPDLESMPVEELLSEEGGENLAVGSYVELHGDIEGFIMLLLDMDSALEVAAQVTGMEAREFTAMEESVIQEVGNIMSAHLANTISDFLGMRIMPSPPSLAVDMGIALLDAVMVEQAQKVEQALVFKTRFLFHPKLLMGKIFLIPELESLERIVGRIREMVA